MREIITYVAYDDTEFDNRKECEQYEGKAFGLLAEIFNAYEFFYENGQELFIFLNGIEEGLNVFNYAWNECDKIKVKWEISHKARDFIDCYFGYKLPPNQKGLYEYDWEQFEWIKVDK